MSRVEKHSNLVGSAKTRVSMASMTATMQQMKSTRQPSRSSVSWLQLIMQRCVQHVVQTEGNVNSCKEKHDLHLAFSFFTIQP